MSHVPFKTCLLTSWWLFRNTPSTLFECLSWYVFPPLSILDPESTEQSSKKTYYSCLRNFGFSHASSHLSFSSMELKITMDARSRGNWAKASWAMSYIPMTVSDQQQFMTYVALSMQRLNSWQPKPTVLWKCCLINILFILEWIWSSCVGRGRLVHIEIRGIQLKLGA